MDGTADGEGERTVASLVAAAASGDQDAWDSIVERYAPLLARVLAGYRLPAAGRQDVAQIVWLRLVENLDRVRSPEALPMWLITTARREALRQLAASSRTSSMDPQSLAWTDAVPVGPANDLPDDAPDAALLAAERHEALLAAMAELPDRQRRLLVLLISEPPLSYAQIAQRLGVPVGWIGPTRQRALDRLRRSEFLAGLADAQVEPAWGRS